VLIPASSLRENAPRLPEVDELTLTRHYVRLSQINFSIDSHFYPLGSCTMKFNPKMNEVVAATPGFALAHPMQDESQIQGWLAVLFELQQMLTEIAGMDACSVQPCAGAQGEFAGLLMIRQYHLERGEGAQRSRIICPDTAHGTNPASAARCGYGITSVKSNAVGCIDLDEMKKALGTDVAAVMITNPNTLGVFEKEIVELAKMAHNVGAQMYMDGANMNAIQGQVKPGDMGFDVMHYNTHKTFSTPHGGGGPGCGPVCVKRHLEPYLPVPVIARVSSDECRVTSDHHSPLTANHSPLTFHLNCDRPHTIGKLHAFLGNAGVSLRAWSYIRHHGAEGIKANSDNAVLNANYLLALLKDTFRQWSPGVCMHEFVVSATKYKAAHNVRAWDIAKRLIDYGFHPPTVYFPLIASEGMMIEPTESESKETLDAFASALMQIAREAVDNPDLVRAAPHTTPVGRLDEVKAVKELNLRWQSSE